MTADGAIGCLHDISMKSNRQQKRKLTEVSVKQGESLGVSVKKFANGGHQKATGFLNLVHSPESPQKNIRLVNNIMKLHQLEPQIQTAKVRLQLFPINENTRLGLEKDGHNPFLELTLSDRKKISSVVRHLNTKWGSSSVAIGQLVLFPYNTKLEQLASCRRWTSNDCAITAGEVYVAVGSPFLFRLRYGWCSNIQLEMFGVPSKTRPFEARIDSEGKSKVCSRVSDKTNHQEEKLDETGENFQKQINVNEALCSDVNESKVLNVPTDHVDDEVTIDVAPVLSKFWDDNSTNLSIGGLSSEVSFQALLSGASLLGKISNNDTKSNQSTLQPIELTCSDISIGGLISEASLHSKSKSDRHRMEGAHAQLKSPWDDKFTTLSIGGSWAEASLQGKGGCNPESKENKSSLHLYAPFSDSLGAFIDAQLNVSNEPNMSLFDAEETCHAFPMRKLQLSSKDPMTSDARVGFSGCSNSTNSKRFQFTSVAKKELSLRGKSQWPPTISHDYPEYTGLRTRGTLLELSLAGPLILHHLCSAFSGVGGDKKSIK